MGQPGKAILSLCLSAVTITVIMVRDGVAGGDDFIGRWVNIDEKSDIATIRTSKVEDRYFLEENDTHVHYWIIYGKGAMLSRFTAVDNESDLSFLFAKAFLDAEEGILKYAASGREE